VRRVNRPDTWQHRLASQDAHATLANGEPSTHGYEASSHQDAQHDRCQAESGRESRYVCSAAISAASPSAADTAVRWPGGQYLTRFGRRKARKATVAYIRRLLAAHLTHHGRPRLRQPRGPKALCLACEPCHRSDSRMMVSARAAVAPGGQAARGSDCRSTPDFRRGDFACMSYSLAAIFSPACPRPAQRGWSAFGDRG
jgi:hypothetical protein